MGVAPHAMDVRRPKLYVSLYFYLLCYVKAYEAVIDPIIVLLHRILRTQAHTRCGLLLQ